MQIKRDYSQPFFSNRRRRRTGGRFLFVYGLFIGGLLMFVSSQFGRLQLMALDMVGMAPTPTPFASTWAQQGYDFLANGKLEQAATAFRQAVSQQPDNINYLYEYGRLLIELDRAADPEQGREISDLELASQLGETSINVAPQDPRGYALKAKALVWLDDSKSAIPIAQQGIDIDPNFAPLYAVLARAYVDLGRYQLALDNGDLAITIDSMDADAHRSYAIALMYVGLNEEAIRQLEDAVNINPNISGPYFELAAQYNFLNLTEEAVATYEQILKLDPRNTKAMLRLCEVYFKVGEGSQAQGYCQDALDIDPNYKEAYRQMGMVNYSRRNYEGAIQNFDKCVELESTEVECYYLRGLAHYYIADGQNGECEQAWDILNETLRDFLGTAPEDDPVLISTREGLRLVTVVCPQYMGQAVPTMIPTEGPLPTPLGGLGG
jgi:tetratricopeptide (TPR) repeat protein